MQYLTRVVLSSLLPRCGTERSWVRRVVLPLAGVAVVLVGFLWFRAHGAREAPVAAALGLQPLHRTDEKGDQWTIEPAVAQPFARLQQGHAAPGLPLTIRTDLRRDSLNRVSLGLTIEGQAGERYSPRISRNGVVLPPPEFVVVNEAKAVVAKGKFEYG
jgi:hypothetical protein